MNAEDDDRYVRAHRETVAGALRYRIGIGEHLALSLSRVEARSLCDQLNEFAELAGDPMPDAR